MAKIHIFNPQTGPVVYSEDGRILGGGEHREVDVLDKHGKACVKRGYLTVIEDDKPQDESEDAPAKAARRSSAKAKSDDVASGASDQPSDD